MKRKISFFDNVYLVLLLLAAYCPSSAQTGLERLELGFTFSSSTYFGDLGGNGGEGISFLQANNLSMSRLIAGAHASAYLKDWVSLRFAINYGNLAGDDAAIKGKSSAEEVRRSRNLHFKTRIAEAFLAAELYPTVFLERDPSNRFHKVRPYFLIGGGFYHFKPRAKDPVDGEWVDLKGLHTEGQGFPEYPDRNYYKLTQLNIPLGGGLKYFVDNNVSVSLELIHRKLFTDYIDDVSTTYINNDLFYKYLPPVTAALAERMSDKSFGVSNRRPGDERGKAGNKDAYFTAGIKLSIGLGGGSSFAPGSNNSLKCPVNVR